MVLERIKKQLKRTDAGLSGWLSEWNVAEDLKWCVKRIAELEKEQADWIKHKEFLDDSLNELYEQIDKLGDDKEQHLRVIESLKQDVARLMRELENK